MNYPAEVEEVMQEPRYIRTEQFYVPKFPYAFMLKEWVHEDYCFPVFVWCVEQFGEEGERWGPVKWSSTSFYEEFQFRDEVDAVLFKLRWC